jgi:phosphoribosylglycinamide formyltransferase-1
VLRVGFCVSGKGRLVRSALLHREELGIDPALVVLDAKADGAVERFCAEHGVPTVRLTHPVRSEFDAELTRTCGDAGLDLLSLTFDRLVPAELIRRYPDRILNVHLSLLPAFVGFRAIENALSVGCRFVGASIHEVTEAVDGGPLIAQCVLGTRPGDTPVTVGARLFPLLRLMYLQVIAWYAAGRVHKDETGRTWVRDAVYGELPISPAIESAFAD